TGKPRFVADVAIANDRIVLVGDSTGWHADTRVDATNLVLTPGFIDVHTHGGRMMLSDGDMRPKVSQGGTTVVAGNCGISLAPTPRTMRAPITPPLNLLDGESKWLVHPTFASYVRALADTPPATNSALLVGHTTLRIAAMPNAEYDRPANAAEIDVMKDLLREAMQAGAIGLSTGLAYDPAIASTTEEIIELAKVASEYGG